MVPSKPLARRHLGKTWTIKGDHVNIYSSQSNGPGDNLDRNKDRESIWGKTIEVRELPRRVADIPRAPYRGPSWEDLKKRPNQKRKPKVASRSIEASAYCVETGETITCPGINMLGEELGIRSARIIRAMESKKVLEGFIFWRGDNRPEEEIAKAKK